MGDWATPDLQPDPGKLSALSASSLRARRIAAKGARGMRRPCRPRAAKAAGTRRARHPRCPHCRAAEGRPCDPSGPVEQRGTPRDTKEVWPPGGDSDGAVLGEPARVRGPGAAHSRQIRTTPSRPERPCSARRH